MTVSVSSAIDVVAVVSAVLALPMVALRLGRAPSGPASARRPSLLVHPWTLFLLVCAAALLNQVAVSAYVLAVHRGDVEFITRYLGRLYFHVAPEFPGVRALAESLGPAGAERWLAWSVLRVNALLELPFALFAYLAVVRLFDARAAQVLMRPPLGVMAAASFTVTLCLIELRLENPWTSDDLWLRGVSFVLLSLALVGLSRSGSASPPAGQYEARSMLAFLAAVVGAASIAGVVLLMFDVALLYNLSHLSRVGPALLGLTLAATVASVAVPRLELRGRASAACGALTSVASSLSMLFFVPALAVRYGRFQPVARGCGLVLLSVAVVVGLLRALPPRAPGRWRWLVGLGVGLGAGTSALWLALPRLQSVSYGEAGLVVEALVFVVPCLAVWMMVEPRAASELRGPRPHQADGTTPSL